MTAPLVPEIRLRLATAMLPIWQASEETLQTLGVEPPYWAFCWPGSQALARLLLDQPLRARDRRVLDLAAGCGLAALAAARCGAAAVTANEIDPMALAAIALNAELNSVTVGLEPRDLAGEGATGDWDLILAGDVCYQQGMAERIVDWLRRQAARGAEVLLGDPGRSYLPSCGLDCVVSYVVPTSLDLEDRESKETTVWRLRG
jgi:predicted nicotinamide N-methyase